MKALTLLPKKIKETYRIKRREDCVEIHSPSYINIYFDDEFKIFKAGNTYEIINSKVLVNLWIEAKKMHVTVYK